MAVQRVHLRVRFADTESVFSDYEDRELFIALTQWLFDFGHSRGYY